MNEPLDEKIQKKFNESQSINYQMKINESPV